MVIKLSQIILLCTIIRSASCHSLAETPKNQSHVATASIKKPIHNVKEARISEPYHRTYPANRYSSSLEIVRCALVLHSFRCCSAVERYAVCLVELIGIEPMT